MNRRPISVLATHYRDGEAFVLETPIIVAGTGSRDLGKEGFAGRDLALAMAALIHAAGDRKDVLLRIGDCRTGGDRLLTTASRRLGWLVPKVFRADWDAWCHDCYPLGDDPGHRRTHSAPSRAARAETGASTYCPNAGPIRNTAIVAGTPRAHRGVALLKADVRNSGTLDCATKMVRAGIPVTCWCDECGPLAPLAQPCREHSLPSVLARWQAQAWGTAA